MFQETGGHLRWPSKFLGAVCSVALQCVLLARAVQMFLVCTAYGGALDVDLTEFHRTDLAPYPLSRHAPFVHSMRGNTDFTVPSLLVRIRYFSDGSIIGVGVERSRCLAVLFQLGFMDNESQRDPRISFQNIRKFDADLHKDLCTDSVLPNGMIMFRADRVDPEVLH